MEMDPRDLYEQTKSLNMRPLCDPHGSELIDRLIYHGLGTFVHELAEDPDLVVEQGLDLIRKIQAAPNAANLSPFEVQQFATPVNFQPMLMATMHIFVMGAQSGCNPMLCIICQLNERRSEDGRCLCQDNPDCTAKAPGSIPPFETFLDFIAERQAEWAREKGLIP